MLDLKKFKYHVLLFLAPCILLSIPLDYCLSYILKQSHLTSGEYEVWNDIYESKANCDIAIYGSSRAWVHIDPSILNDTLNESVYNFGINGHNFWLQYLRHIELIKYNVVPKKIILSVDMFTLEKRTDLFLMEQFLPYMLWNENIKKYTISSVGFNSADYSIPLVRYFGSSKSFLKTIKSFLNFSSKDNFRKKGFRGMDRKWNDDFQTAKDSLGEYVSKVDVKSIELLEKFILECKDLNIDLMFVYTPEYIKGQQFVSNRKQVLNIFSQYAKKYNLVFLDYSTDSICLKKNLFYNASHLNKTGAKIFSEKLAGDLKNLN